MIVPFTDSVTATAVYINPSFVVSMRPDPRSPRRLLSSSSAMGNAFVCRATIAKLPRSSPKRLFTRLSSIAACTAFPRLPGVGHVVCDPAHLNLPWGIADMPE